jgi:hypothetical protein
MPMRPLFLHHAFLFAATALLLCACHGKDETSQPGGGTPEAALQRSIDLFKAGDFQGMWKQSLPPADYANLRADWRRQQRQPLAISNGNRTKFTEAMQKLTASDAGKNLFAQLQPRLIRVEQEYGDQLPVLLKVAGAMAKAQVAQDQNLSSSEKSRINNALDALAPWMQQTPWFDQARAKQAIAVMVATARKLDLKSTEQLHSMDFASAMGKYAIGYVGLKQLLSIYGLSVDDTLNSIKLTPVSESHGHAMVKIEYTLLGKPLSAEFPVVEQDGRWYSEDLLEQTRASHQRVIQSMANLPAGSATTTPAAAATPTAATRSAAGKA